MFQINHIVLSKQPKSNSWKITRCRTSTNVSQIYKLCFALTSIKLEIKNKQNATFRSPSPVFKETDPNIFDRDVGAVEPDDSTTFLYLLGIVLLSPR